MHAVSRVEEIARVAGKAVATLEIYGPAESVDGEASAFALVELALAVYAVVVYVVGNAVRVDLGEGRKAPSPEKVVAG